MNSKDNLPLNNSKKCDPNIMVVIPSANIEGGGDIWILELLLSKSLKYQNLLLIFEHNGELIKKLKNTQHRIFILDEYSEHRKPYFFKIILRLSKLIRLEKPDLIIHWTSRAHIYGSIAKAISLFFPKTIWFQHVIPSKFWLHQMANLFPSAAVICVSSAVANKQKELFPKSNPIILHPGSNRASQIDKDYSNKALFHNRKISLGVLARIEPWKGQDIFLLAISILKKQGFFIHGILVGDVNSTTWPNFPSKIKKLINKEKINNNVTILGHIQDIKTCLRNIDILVCSSREEGFGLSIIDGMSYGIPVIATRCGGPNDILTNNLNGILIEPNNPVALANAVKKYIKDIEFTKEIIRHAKETYMNKFTAQHSAQRLSNLLSMLLASR